MAAKKRIFLVDDHPVTREGFAGLINNEPDLQVCGQAGNSSRATTEICRLTPDLVIVDIALDNSADGLDLIKDLRVLRPELPVLVLSAQDEELFAERALRAGSRGYLMKTEPTTLMVAMATAAQPMMALTSGLSVFAAA